MDEAMERWILKSAIRNLFKSLSIFKSSQKDAVFEEKH